MDFILSLAVDKVGIILSKKTLLSFWFELGHITAHERDIHKLEPLESWLGHQEYLVDEPCSYFFFGVYGMKGTDDVLMEYQPQPTNLNACSAGLS